MLKGRGRSLQKGDTLIEVLFAVTVFSLVAVSSLSIMNQGTAIAQRSLEITLVRQQMDAQAESLRFIHDSYIAAYPTVISTQPAAEWLKIVAKSVSTASTFGTCTPPGSGSPFVVNTKTVKIEERGTILTSSVSTFSQLRYAASSPATIPATTTTELIAAEGIWVEAIRSPIVPGAATGFIDFHIRACWQSPGQSAPMTLGTIVRLYEPR